MFHEYSGFERQIAALLRFSHPEADALRLSRCFVKQRDSVLQLSEIANV